MKLNEVVLPEGMRFAAPPDASVEVRALFTQPVKRFVAGNGVELSYNEQSGMVSITAHGKRRLVHASRCTFLEPSDEAPGIADMLKPKRARKESNGPASA